MAIYKVLASSRFLFAWFLLLGDGLHDVRPWPHVFPAPSTGTSVAASRHEGHWSCCWGQSPVPTVTAQDSVIWALLEAHPSGVNVQAYYEGEARVWVRAFNSGLLRGRSPSMGSYIFFETRIF